jgi:hypothetical protein
MNYVKSFVLTLIISICCTSCSEENDLDYLHPNIGYYEVVSLESNTCMDLDYDAICSTNFRAELGEYWFDSGRSFGTVPLQIVNADHLNYDNVDVLYLELLGMPRDDYNPINENLGVRFKGFVKQNFIHTTRDNGILFIESGRDQNLQLQYSQEFLQRLPVINNFNFDDKNNVTLQISQHFYNYRDDRWQEVELVAKFSRIKNPEIWQL